MGKMKNVNGGSLIEIEEAVAKYVKRQRVMLGLSQNGVALRVGLARATYSNIETGKRCPTLRQFIRLCDVLYLSPQEIINEAITEL